MITSLPPIPCEDGQHMPVIVSTTGGKDVQLTNTCGLCGRRIQRETTAQPWTIGPTQREIDLLKLPNVRRFVDGDLDWFSLSADVQERLYEFYYGMMPYGMAKARTGDPDQWIVERLAKLIARRLAFLKGAS